MQTSNKVSMTSQWEGAGVTNCTKDNVKKCYSSKTRAAPLRLYSISSLLGVPSEQVVVRPLPENKVFVIG